MNYFLDIANKRFLETRNNGTGFTVAKFYNFENRIWNLELLEPSSTSSIYRNSFNTYYDPSSHIEILIGDYGKPLAGYGILNPNGSTYQGNVCFSNGTEYLNGETLSTCKIHVILSGSNQCEPIFTGEAIISDLLFLSGSFNTSSFVHSNIISASYSVTSSHSENTNLFGGKSIDQFLSASYVPSLVPSASWADTVDGYHAYQIAIKGENIVQDTALRMNGNKLYSTNLFIETNGNVGIGTTGHSHKLYVSGSTTIKDKLVVGNTLEVGSPLYQDSILHLNNGGNVPTILIDDFLSTIHLVVTGSKVGIATDKPVYNLDVFGDGRITGNLYATCSKSITSSYSHQSYNSDLLESYPSDAFAQSDGVNATGTWNINCISASWAPLPVGTGSLDPHGLNSPYHTDAPLNLTNGGTNNTNFGGATALVKYDYSNEKLTNLVSLNQGKYLKDDLTWTNQLTGSLLGNATTCITAQTASYMSGGSIDSASYSALARSSSYARTASFFGNGTNNYLPKWNSNTLTATSSLYDNGNSVMISCSFLPYKTSIIDIGSDVYRFGIIYASDILCGALFESGLKTEGVKNNPTGTVLVLNSDGKLEPCSSNESDMVIAVSKNGKDEPITLGAEPILVTGKVKVGDFIGTSSKPGHGKALKKYYLGIFKRNLFGKVIAQAITSGEGESHTIKGMICKR